MRWRRIAFWSGFGLLALIVLAISWLLLADLGSFKPQIEQWVSQKTGREFSIGGRLEIDLAAQSTVVAENVRISNADWADDSDMLAVGRLEVRLDLRSLLGGSIIVESIDIDGLQASLEKREQGDPNWVLQQTEDEVVDNEERQSGKVIIFEHIDIQDVTLKYSSPDRNGPLQLQIKQLLQKHRDDDFLQLYLDGSVNGRELKLDGEVGTWKDLLQKKDVQFDIGVRMDSFVVSAEGFVDDLGSPYRPRLNFTARAPDINHVFAVLGIDQQGDGDIDLIGSLQPMDQGPLVLSVAGDVGRLSVETSGEFSNLRDLEEVDLELLATGDDVRPILEAFGLPQSKATPFMVNVDALKKGSSLVVEKADMIFGQAKLELAANLPNFPKIDDSGIELRINGPDIERFRDVFSLPGAATGPFSIGFTVDVDDKGVELLNLDIETNLGELKAEGMLGDAPDYYGTTLSFSAFSDDLARLGAAYGIQGLPVRPIEIGGSAELGPDGIRTVKAVTAHVNDVSLSIEGLVKMTHGALGSDLDFSIDGPDLAIMISAFADATAVPAQPYALQGQLQIRDDGYRFREVGGSIGTTTIDIDGLLVPAPGISGSRFNFAARGAAFTELTAGLGDLDVRPGPFALSGAVNLHTDLLELTDVRLERATGKVDLQLQLGLPISRRWANFDVQASGPNVRSLLRRVDSFEALEAPFSIDVDGELRDTSWQIDTLEIDVGTAELSAKGTFDLSGATSATQFAMSLNIPDTQALGSWNDRRLRGQSFTLNANVAGSQGELRMDNLAATLGSSDISGDILYRNAAVPYISATIKSESLVLQAILEDLEEEQEPPSPLDDGRLIPDIEVPFDAMSQVNAEVELNVGQLQYGALHIRDLYVSAALQDGSLQLSDAGFRARSGALRARGQVAPNGGAGTARLELVARDFALGMTEMNNDLAMTGDIDINLDGTGTNLRTILGSANGIFFFNSRGGRMADNKALSALYGNALQEIIGAINPFAKSQPYTNFECVILPIEVIDGTVSSNPNSLLATDKIQIATKSEVDLKTEKIDVNIRTTPKKGLSISAGEIVNPYIKVVGTLAAPRLAVDETGVLLSGGAAFATGGLSILARAAWTRLSRASDPCAQLEKDGLESIGGRFPDLNVPRAVPSAQIQGQ